MSGSALDNWIDDFLYSQGKIDWSISTCTFHPFATSRSYRMLALEKLISTLADDGAEFITMAGIAIEYKKISI